MRDLKNLSHSYLKQPLVTYLHLTHTRLLVTHANRQISETLACTWNLEEFDLRICIFPAKIMLSHKIDLQL